MLAVVTVPAHGLALNAPWPKAPPAPAHAVGRADQVAHSRQFWLLAAALTLSAFTVYAVVVALVPLLLERGFTTTMAAWALGLGGAGQTLGRTLYATLARRTGVTARTVALIALGGLTTAALALVPGPYALLVVLSVAAGMVRGNLTLLQATAITDRWGTTHYGRLSGLLAAPATGRPRPRPVRRRCPGRAARWLPPSFRTAGTHFRLRSPRRSHGQGTALHSSRGDGPARRAALNRHPPLSRPGLHPCPSGC